MTRWSITSSAGIDLGTYEADTADEALDGMARAAGYQSQADAASVAGPFDGAVEAVEAVEADDTEPTIADRAREALEALRTERAQRMTEAAEESLVDTAYRAAIRWHAGVVDDLVEDVLAALASGDTDEDGLEDYLHETIDGCGAVIYCRQAALVLLASTNDDAGDEMGATETSARAYCALLADVRDELARYDLGL